jgi:hypothetical protein
MTRKDYVMIAAAIRDAREAVAMELGEHHSRHVADAAMRDAANYIADGCKADNPRFDRSRFLAACGGFSKSEPARSPA